MLPQSATSLTDFQTCPMLYFFQHVKRLRLIEEPENLRIGTHWHKLLEILTAEPESSPTYRQMNLLQYLNNAYASKPHYIELTDWELERTVLLCAALSWQHRWQDDQVETVATEVRFDRTIHTRLRRVGKIDRLIRWQGQLLIGEYKSTKSSLDSDSDYWNRLRHDLQITLYVIEARHLQCTGQLELHGIKPTDPLISGCLFDVWRKPAIRPKLIKGERETVEQFGERLAADMQEFPDKYFARKEVPRTDEELIQADEEFQNMERAIQFIGERNLWWHDRRECEQFGRCRFYPICVRNTDVEAGVPEGFRVQE